MIVYETILEFYEQPTSSNYWKEFDAWDSDGLLIARLYVRKDIEGFPKDLTLTHEVEK